LEGGGAVGDGPAAGDGGEGGPHGVFAFVGDEDVEPGVVVVERDGHDGPVGSAAGLCAVVVGPVTGEDMADASKGGIGGHPPVGGLDGVVVDGAVDGVGPGGGADGAGGVVGRGGEIHQLALVGARVVAGDQAQRG